MTVTDEREDLINEICQYLMPIVPDVSDAKNALYMIMNNYEITSRCTDIVEIHEDRNEALLQKFLVAKTVKGCTPRTLEYYGISIRKDPPDDRKDSGRCICRGYQVLYGT